MELVALRGVSLPRPGAEDAPPLLDAVDLTLGEGARIGLVGRSGAGKSTLLDVVAGRTVAPAGSVVRAPGVRVSYLRQATALDPDATVEDAARAGLSELRALEARLRDAERALADGGGVAADRYAALLVEHEHLGGYGAEAALREVLHALGFTPEGRGRRVGELSAGERRRLALAVALATPADVLLLDEPTNQLDVLARVWLEQHLSRRPGAAVVVSHDRALLTAATNATGFLAAGRLRVHPGGYDRAARRAAAEDAASERRARELRREAERLTKVAAELARYGRRSRSRERRADELASAAGAQPGTAGAGAPSLAFRITDRRRRGWLLWGERLSAQARLAGAEVRLAAGDAVALMGPNGSGKSTLLALLAGTLPSTDPQAKLEFAPGLRLVHVGQEDRGLGGGESVLQQLATPLGDELARARLAEAGLPYASWSLPPTRLSGGERARAGLALALALEPDVLLLDEPDNDLDLEALTALERSLQELARAGCAIVLATHDRRLAESVCRRAWEVAGGRLVAYASVRAYLRGEAALPAEAFFSVGPSPLATALPDPEPVPDPLAELESERAGLLASLADPLGRSERDLGRARARLREVEGEIVARLDERLPPPAPRYAFREGGLSLQADASPGAPVPTWTVFAAANGERGARAGAAAGPAPPVRLHVRLLGDVAHLALEEAEGTCTLPYAAAALLDAGARLAFTVAGAVRAQAYVAERVPATLLAPDGSGWRFLDLGGFLVLEGWAAGRRAARERPGR